MKNIIPLIARILLSGVFLYSAYSKVTNPTGTIQYMASHGIPFPNVLLIPTVLVLLAGGFSVLLGYKIRWGAMLLILFLIPATLIFHTKFAEPIQVIHFWKNLGLIGGLLLLLSTTPGKFSLDLREKRTFKSSGLLRS